MQRAPTVGLTVSEKTYLRRKNTLRLRGCDYSFPGGYFITVCTYDHECTLGRVINGEMFPSPAGQLVTRHLLRSTQLRDSISLDCCVIMPNHVHFILMIAEAENPSNPSVAVRKFGDPRSGSVSTIVRLIKSACTSAIRRREGNAGLVVWQRNFHDHVIRDENDLKRIREYIATNPLKWHLDRYYPEA